MSAPSLLDRITGLRDVAETLAFAAIGGLSFGLAGIPAGYLSGSILAVAIAALSGRPMHMPAPMVRVLIVLIGTSLGAVVTPETLRGVTTYPASIAVLVAATIVISVAGTAYLRVVHGWDRLTAYLASVPGGLSQVMALAIEFKADVRAIAIVQTIRVIILSVCLPALFAALGLVAAGATGRPRPPFDGSQIKELAILLAVSTVSAIVAHRVRFPGGLLFGAMLASAALHGTDTLHVMMPSWVYFTVMVAFGAVSGARFANTPVRLLLRFTGAAFGVFAVAVVITAGFAMLVLAMLDVPVAEVMVAYAPGAVDAMLLLALALNFDPVYVGTHHLVRIFFVMAATPLIVRMGARAKTEPPPLKPEGDSQPPRQTPFQD